MSKIRSRTLAASCAALLMSSMLANAQNTAPQTFEITPQNLSSALTEFARQSGTEILYSPDIVSDKSSPGVRGKLDPMSALTKLLFDSGLTFTTTPQGAILLQPATQPAAKMQTIALLQESVDPSTETASSAPTSSDDSTNAARAVRLEEVIVTGSHIRGAQNLSSPVITFDRKDIEASGYATTQQLIQSLPQNLNNISDGTVGNNAGGTGWTSTYDGSGINLRGLGSDATLVLLNGRRLASAGDGSFVDVSLVPLNAIERVDVLTDGASAIYGSDAVGGVVNLVLRKDFTGAETRVRYGSVTEGSHRELQAGQMFGHSWASGQALVSYDYTRKTPLDGIDRDFFDPNVSSYNQFWLIPRQQRQSALAVFSQRLSERIELSGDLFYSERETRNGFGYSTTSYDISSDVRQYGASAGLRVDFDRDWQLRVSGLLDQSDSQMSYNLHWANGILGARFGNESNLASLDVAADGPLVRVPGGDVRLALGAQARREKFTEENVDYPARLDRNIAAIYAEVQVPWVSDQNRRTGLERLELTLAGRYEDYSDFGTTFNPKIGLAWMPTAGLIVRSTWGTSFKAPLLNQLNSGNGSATVGQDHFLGSSGWVTALVLQGNGVGLQPEESRNWTAGFDFSPAAAPQLSISATYFDIDYSERIRSPFPDSYDWSGVLLDPTYSIVVEHQPDPTFLRSLIERTPFVSCYTATYDFCDANQALDRVEAILDARLRNLADVRMSGLDLSLSYRHASAVGNFGIGLSGSRLLENRQRLVPGVPSTNELNDVYRPVDLRLRSTLSFSRGGFDVVTALNYVDGYRDLRPVSSVGNAVKRSTVASWTTVDLTVQYDLGRLWADSWLPDTTVQLSAVNILDKSPPYVAGYTGLHFDAVNASGLGRFISAQLNARW